MNDEMILTAPETQETSTAEAADGRAKASAAEDAAMAHTDADAAAAEGDDDEYYRDLLDGDLAEIRAADPGLPASFSVSDIRDPVRYGALRDLGLSATEAYLAVGGARRAADSRGHLTSTVPRGSVGRHRDIPRAEYATIRNLFSDMPESELQRLYRKVSG